MYMIVYSNAASNRVYFSGSNPYPNPNAPRNPRSSSLHFQNPKLCHSRAQSQSFMALHLCKPKHRSLANPSLIHFFSTSQNDNNGNTNNNFSQSPLNSYFSDVKASLKNEHQSPQTQPFSGAPRKVASIEEIKKNLSEFRERSAAPNPTEANRTAPQQSKQPQSFQELYKRNTNNYFSKGGKVSIEAIKESLRQMKPKNSNRNNAGASAESSSFSNFSYSLRVKPEVGNTNTLVGGTQELPKSVFEREMREEGKSVERDRMKTEFVKMYSYEELGAKLRTLRPGGLDGGFSFGELNERLMKLRELEEKENESRLVGVPFKVLRDSLANMKILDEEKSRKSSTLRHVILGQLGATPEYMQYPPQKHLVEKYFHPDNMSSTEKLKIALAKVREEFKMSESDCGSARVQIAQLTTKIKHLSLVLHKKDKHSLKGLQAMVQRRKRLLKYLRRTDWDSYCFVLSKLGLRDNPEYKTLS